MQRSTPRALLLATLLPLTAGAAFPAAAHAAATAPPETRSNQVPERVVYWHLFRHVVALERQAEELERRQEDGAKLRAFYRQSAGLSDGQAQLLVEIASACVSQVAAVDRRARAVISAARAAFAGGWRAGGQGPPPPPPELEQLQEERDAIVVQAHDRLRQGLGEQDFQRFHQFVLARIAPGIRQLTPGLTLPPPTTSLAPKAAGKN